MQFKVRFRLQTQSSLKKEIQIISLYLMANKILGGGGEARLFLNLREDKGYTYGAYSSTGNDKYVAQICSKCKCT